jgi:hypothetical protein
MSTVLDLAAAAWRKSTHSGNSGDCVEIAPGFAVVPVRDSKDPSVGHLIATPASWSALLSTLRTV